jgi:hypothetical protein
VNQQGTIGTQDQIDALMGGGYAYPFTTPAGETMVGQQFPGPFIAPVNQMELQSLAARQGVADQMQNVGAGVMNLGQQTAAGDFLRAESNPYLQSAIQAAITPQLQAYERVFAPQLASQGIQSGAFKGSSARQFADQALYQDIATNIQNTASSMAFENLARERELQQQAPQLIDAAARLQQLHPELLGQVGGGIRGIEQQAIDEQLLRMQEQIEAPFRPLYPLASMLQGTDIGSTATVSQPRPSPATRGILGAMGGAGMGYELGSNVGDYGGWGAGLGALLGGLGSAF